MQTVHGFLSKTKKIYFQTSLFLWNSKFLCNFLGFEGIFIIFLVPGVFRSGAEGRGGEGGHLPPLNFQIFLII